MDMDNRVGTDCGSGVWAGQGRAMGGNCDNYNRTTIKKKRDFRAKWRHRSTYCTSSPNQNKDNNKFKNKKQPELTENRIVWKSDNEGVKEETFIQTGRRGGDGQPGGEDLWQGGGWRTGHSHIRVQINWEEHLGSKTDCTTQGFTVGK